MYDALLFDFDGVLADTEPVHFACWEAVLSPLGAALEWEGYERHCIGIPDTGLLEFFGGLFSPRAPESRVRAWYRRKQELYRERVCDGSVIATATRQFLKDLAPRFSMAVVSSSEAADVEPVLWAAGVRLYFHALVCREDVPRHKPAPDPYLAAARVLGAARPLVIEDSAAGLESARAAGFDAVHVGSASALPTLVAARLASAEAGTTPRLGCESHIAGTPGDC